MEAEQATLDARKETDIAIGKLQAGLGAWWERTKAEFYRVIEPVLDKFNVFPDEPVEATNLDLMLDGVRKWDEQWRHNRDPNWPGGFVPPPGPPPVKPWGWAEFFRGVPPPWGK